MRTKEINFSKFSSMKLGGVREVMIMESCEDVPPLGSYLIGGCNNILMGDNPPPLFMLSKSFDVIEFRDERLYVGAATPSGRIASFCKKNDIADFEFLSHLPGTLGGIVKMNAGLKEWEIFNHLHSIFTCRGEILKESLIYGYRTTSISEPILGASFFYKRGFDVQKVLMFEKMRANQPSTPSAGSCFKNPVGDYAGRLIESVGLKGFRRGGMEFSSVHANFLVNHGGGLFADAIWLIQEVQKRVYEASGIWLACEIAVLDERFMGAHSPLLAPQTR